MEALQNFGTLLSGEETIIVLLKNIHAFWASNKEFWFSHTPIDSWEVIETQYQNTATQNISLLLHYDQIYRHPCPAIKESNKSLAYRFATHIAFRILHSGQYERLTTWEKVFVLLCFRHNNSIVLKSLALTKTFQLLSNESANDPLVLRFLNATIWSIHEWKEKTVGYPEEPVQTQLTDQRLQTFQSILEASKPIPTEFCSKTTETLLKETFHSAFKTAFQKFPETNRIAVSISGGVDSMVAAYIGKQVADSMGKELILLHINYGNRDCCEAECDLLRWFSNKLKTSLYIRTITEMQRCRTSDLRTLYEDVTRRIRFSFYTWFKCPIILGHNLDDCYENIFQNLAKQIHFENLFGMSEIGQEQGVTTVRPMLRIPKKDIVAFADSVGIPHLVDSTPKWSQRGQMRDTLIPGIQTFDPHILMGLQKFVEHSRFLEKQWISQFNIWTQSRLEKSTTSLWLPRDIFFSENCQTLNFWIRIWQTLSLPNRPSNKSFQSLMDTLKLSTSNRKCTMNAICRANIQVDGIEFVWSI